DTLLIPVRFWGSRAPRTPDPDSWKREHPSPDWLIRRPPSSSAWVLYQNMMRIWNYTFIPAVWLTGAALITLCQSIMRLRRITDWWVVLAGALFALLVLV